jgi:hypothetical protein
MYSILKILVLIRNITIFFGFFYLRYVFKKVPLQTLGTYKPRLRLGL